MSGAVAFKTMSQDGPESGSGEPERVMRPRRGHGTRQRILGIARQLLRERPFVSVSMEMVAERSGVSRRSVYNHFPDREQLYRASRELLLAELAGLINPTLPPTQRPELALLRFAQSLVRLFDDERYAELLLSVIRDGPAQPWIVEAFDRRVRAPLLQALELYFMKVQAGGRLTVEDPALAARFFLGLVESRTIVPALMGETGEATERVSNPDIAAQITAHFLRGISADAQTISRMSQGVSGLRGTAL